MTPISRRDFLKALAVSAGALATGQGSVLGQLQGSALQFLVIGDSLIWGQGLEEKDKFYSLTADWLRNDAFGRPRKVDLKVKAHSGANLKMHPATAERLQKAGLDEYWIIDRFDRTLTVANMIGPERLSGDWWRDGYGRDYWRCESDEECGELILYRDASGWWVQGWYD